MSNKKISVCMCTYNGEKYIRQQLDSIISQLKNSDEFIISDDGSTDQTKLIIFQAISSANVVVRVVKGPCAGAPILNFEYAMGLATGDIIVLADQDDVWFPGRLEMIRNEFSRRVNLKCLMLDSVVIDGESNVIESSIVKAMGVKTGFWVNLWKVRYIGCHMAFTSDVRDCALPIPRGIGSYESWIGLVAEQLGGTLIYDVASMFYRRHSQNFTKKDNGYFCMLSWRLHLALNVLFWIVKRKRKYFRDYLRSSATMGFRN